MFRASAIRCLPIMIPPQHDAERVRLRYLRPPRDDILLLMLIS